MADNEYKKLRSQKYYFYRDDYEKIPKNAAEVNVLLDGDEEVNSSRLKTELLLEQLSHIEKIMKMLEVRGYQIKNAIDFKKFQAGEY